MSFLHPLPPITIGNADYDRLVPLAEAVRHRRPDVADMLSRELARADLQPQDGLDRRVVAMNSRVLFGYCHSRDTQAAKLVYPAEADIALGRLSIATPVGAALLGLCEGDSIGWLTASGLERRITLHRVSG